MLTCANCGRESPEDFAFCPACSAPLAPPGRQEVRKTVTVVFCDVTGSTAMGERLDPESLRRVMSRYFAEMRAALERHGGTVEKFIGDAVMAVFGVPAIHEDDALRAVRAAAEMREALQVFNKELERDHGVSLAARIGVNTGEVVAGDQGDTLVTGDAVNVAARLEQAAEPGTVLIGEETLRLVRDAVVAEPVPPLEVKGKSEPLAAFRLVQVTAGVAGVARRLDSPMVGRERELARLRQTFEAAIADRSCQLFTILGTPGVGKSRLVEEFLGSLGEATVLRGRCLPYGEGITFFPVGEVVKEAAGLEDFDAPDEIERKICAVLGTDGPACSTLAQLFAAAERDSSVEETFWAVRSFLEAVAQTAPLAVVFDDIHWGEPTFLDLIEHITGWAREAPILVLCVARPELLDERAGWGGGKFNATTISLEPLSDDECGDLIGNLLGRAALPDEARDRILAAAEGTPLFVEEMLSMLIDDGSLARDGDRWVATGPLVDLRVPPTIQALLAARLDQLTGDERAAIQRAAVCGKQFHVGAVAALLDGRRGGPADPDEPGPTRPAPAGPVVARGPGRVPVPPPADPRRRLRGRAEGAPCRAPRAVRRLARGRRGGSRRGVRGDPRVPPGTGTPAPRRSSDRWTTQGASWGSEPPGTTRRAPAERRIGATTGPPRRCSGTRPTSSPRVIRIDRAPCTTSGVRACAASTRPWRSPRSTRPWRRPPRADSDRSSGWPGSTGASCR